MANTLMTSLNVQARTTHLREFLLDCAGSSANEEADRIREATLELGGSGLDGKGALNISAIDSMVKSGCMVDAVLALIGLNASFMLSRGPNGACMASVVHKDGSDEALAEAPTLALALLAAHVSSVLSRMERGLATESLFDSPISTRLH